MVVGGRAAEEGVPGNDGNERMILGDAGGEMFQALPVTAAGGWAPGGSGWGEAESPRGVEWEREWGVCQAGSAGVRAMGGPVVIEKPPGFAAGLRLVDATAEFTTAGPC